MDDRIVSDIVVNIRRADIHKPIAFNRQATNRRREELAADSPNAPSFNADKTVPKRTVPNPDVVWCGSLEIAQ